MPGFSPVLRCLYVTAGLIASLATAHTCLAAPLTVGVPEFLDSSVFTQAMLTPYGKAAKTSIASVAWSGRIEDLVLRRTINGQSSDWDLVLIEGAELEQACQNGVLDRFDLLAFRTKEQFIGAASHRCGLGAFVSSINLVYDPYRFKGRAPENWAAFWDIKRFPGKRTLPATARYTLEVALLADGVVPQKIYDTLKTSEGIERAFKKLAEIKTQIQWVASPEASLQSLSNGDATMAIGPVNRSQLLKNPQGKLLKSVANCHLYNMAFWAIPKSTARKKKAYELVGFFTTTTRQRALLDTLGYGPTRKSISVISSEQTAPSQNSQVQALLIDSSFWGERGSELETRFKNWLGSSKSESAAP